LNMVLTTDSLSFHWNIAPRIWYMTAN
jgi:hypothetical protein